MPEKSVGAKVSADFKRQIESQQRNGENKSDTVRRLLRDGIEHANECQKSTGEALMARVHSGATRAGIAFLLISMAIGFAGIVAYLAGMPLSLVWAAVLFGTAPFGVIGVVCLIVAERAARVAGLEPVTTQARIASRALYRMQLPEECP